MKKKLAIVISHPIQHFCPLYANWAKNQNWEIKVFFASKSGVESYYDENFKKMIVWQGLRLNEFPHEFLNQGQVIDINTSIDAPELEQRLSEYTPDALLIYGYIQKLQRRALTWGKTTKTPIIYFADSEMRQKRSFIKNWIKKIVLPRHFNPISWFLVTGNANEFYYTNYKVSPTKMIRSSYPIDIELYKESWENRIALRHNMRQQLAIPDHSIAVGVVGKLIDRKRQIDLIQSLIRIKNTHITLILIGTGEKEQEWKSEAEKIQGHSIIFTGFVSPESLPSYYAALDIYAHVSEAEPHSVAVSEATYMGCPVILSHTCGSYGMDDDVQVGKNGFVYTCKNTIQLGNLMDTLGSNPRLRKEMSAYSHMNTEKNQNNIHYQVLDTISLCLTMNQNTSSL